MGHSTLPHTFHIPVMGVGFTLATPLAVAKYGIDSVISLVDDVLIEQAREHFCHAWGLPYAPIEQGAPDARARRITAYLDLVAQRVTQEVEAVRQAPLDDPQGIARYVALLPDDAPMRRAYVTATSDRDPEARARAERQLRAAVRPGRVDVNIMTKLDRAVDEKGQPREREGSDALAALRGFAHSEADGSVVLSAGANPKLFGYLAELDPFFPDERGALRKRIILKVSDYRSAQVQGKMLARRGLWVSEYRIESGLNCGGHAFPTEGLLLGPILEQFRSGRSTLRRELFESLSKALAAAGRPVPPQPLPLRVTVQGGIGTAEEDRLLRHRYGVDGTGWASPFLMVPEVTDVDAVTRRQLATTDAEGVGLSWSSPLGVRFWTLHSSESERARRERVARDRPGSTCPKGFLARSTEFGPVPLCTASRGYQQRKLADGSLEAWQRERIQAPACICHDLGASFKRNRGIEEGGTPAICPGPNVVYFQREMSLDQLVGHIYGRQDVLTRTDRPHMFLAEARLYLDLIREELDDAARGRCTRTPKSFAKYLENLCAGLEHYREAAPTYGMEQGQRARFEAELDALRREAEQLSPPARQSTPLAV